MSFGTAVLGGLASVWMDMEMLEQNVIWLILLFNVVLYWRWPERSRLMVLFPEESGPHAGQLTSITK